MQNRSNVDQFIEISSIIGHPENRDLQLQEGDIILFSTAKKPADDENLWFAVGEILQFPMVETDDEIVDHVMGYLDGVGHGRNQFARKTLSRLYFAIRRAATLNSLVEESLHLSAAFQLAGFRHAIGTMWEASDRACVDAAVSVYGWMQRHGMSDESVSEGLHHAIRELRKKWLGRGATGGMSGHREDVEGGSRDTREGRTVVSWEDAPLDWVPFVHFGR